tara:strand:+ start:372 stop:491 length:120 start_codon:yes stop_codon:yes gene_type:complete
MHGNEPEPFTEYPASILNNLSGAISVRFLNMDGAKPFFP